MMAAAPGSTPLTDSDATPDAALWAALRAPEAPPERTVAAVRTALAHLLRTRRAMIDAGGGTDPDAAARWVRELVAVLGWGDDEAASVRPVERRDTADVFECAVYGEAAFTVAALRHGAAARDDAARDAVSFLYNRGDEWGVVADLERVEIVNTRWVAGGQPAPFRSVAVADLAAEAATIALLTPSRVRTRDLFTQAALEAPRPAPGTATLRVPTLDALLAEPAVRPPAEGSRRGLSRGHPTAARRTPREGRVLRPPVTQEVLRTVLACRSAFLAAPPAGVGDDEAAAYDEAVHRLLTRLIFVRACEDLRVRRGERRLRDAETAPDVHTVLGEILAAYREVYESELFAPLDLAQFDAAALRKTVRALYGAPGAVEYDFAAMRADILGTMYEEYLQWEAVAVPADDDGPQRTMFKLRQVRTRNVKRDRGIYYTPAYLVDAMVDYALDLYAGRGLVDGPTPNEHARQDAAPGVRAARAARESSAPLGPAADLPARPPVVGDLACGSGAFLARAFERQHAPDPAARFDELASRLREGIVGADVDKRAVEATRLNLWLTLLRLRPEVRPLPSLAHAVVDRDALLGPILPETSGEPAGVGTQGVLFGAAHVQRDARARPHETAPVRWPVRPDIVLGNPPFVPVERQPAGYARRLREEGFRSVTDRLDVANVFVERALDVVADGGVVALVLPNRVFTSAAAESLRAVLRERAVIEAVVDFGTEQVFEASGASTYVCAVFLRKERPRAKYRFRVIHVDRLERPVGLQLRRALYSQEDVPGVRRYEAEMVRAEGPVLLIPKAARALLRRLTKTGMPLAEVAAVHQGIRAGHQEVFLARLDGAPPPRGTAPETLVSITSYQPIGNAGHATGRVEIGALRPAVPSRSLKRYGPIDPRLRLFYPHDERGALIPLDVYAERFPQAARYLSRFRDVLAARTRVRTGQWHALSTPRHPGWLGAPKILVPQLATEGRLTWDSEGMYLIQGFGVVPRDGVDALALLATLNSTLLVWVASTLGPRYKDNYFEYQGNLLERLPIPAATLDGETSTVLTDRAGALLGHYARQPGARDYARIAELEAEVDAAVYVAAGLSAAEVDQVERDVAAFRPALPLSAYFTTP